MIRWRLFCVVCVGIALGGCNDSVDQVAGSADAGDTGADIDGGGGDGVDGLERDTAEPLAEVCDDEVDNDGDGVLDCDDDDCASDDACAPAREACDDGVDNDGDEAIDCDDADCSDDAACVRGLEICDDGIDNDGDQAVDCADDDCDADAACAVDLCADIDCAALDDACLVGVCDPATGECGAVPVEDGSACDDGSLCTTGDVCTDGECGGAPLDCSDQSDACNIGTCDPVDGTCGAVAVADGAECDDGSLCTTGDVCTAGACGGLEVDCAAYDFGCVLGICDLDSGDCTTTPVDDGVECEDGDACTTGDACEAGVCVGAEVDCSGLDTSCAVGSCDRETGSCEALPIDDFEGCDDGDPCTAEDICIDGICEGYPIDCSELDGPCGTGVCDSDSGGCVVLDSDDGVECDAGSDCLMDTACFGGDCVGVEVEDGTGCFAGTACVVDAVCASGECVGADYDCSDFDDSCNVGVCIDGFVGADCYAEAVLDGTECDDGEAVTGDDSCLLGVCVGCAPDAAEDDDTQADATSIAIGEAVTGRSACLGDADWYSFDLPEGSIAAVSVLGDGFPCGGRLTATLTDAAGVILDEDGGVGLSGCPLVMGAGAAAVSVRAVEGMSFPAYALRLAVFAGVEEESNDGFEEANGLIEGAALAAAVELGGEDWYTFTLATRSLVTLETTGLAGPSSCDTDTFLTLFAGDGEVVLAENDNAWGVCSRLVGLFDPGTYYVSVRGLSELVEGPYGLYFTTAPLPEILAESEPNDLCDDPDGPALGPVTYVGVIDPGTDMDLITVEIPADGTPFVAETSDGAGGCDVNTVLRLDVAGCLSELDWDDDSGPGSCSRLEGRLDAGTYVFAVESFGSATGSYVLDVLF